MTAALVRLNGYARHRFGCGTDYFPGDENNPPLPCDCGLTALRAALLCTCGHAIDVHTTRDVSDVVGWPCNGCRSRRCTGYTIEGSHS